MATRYVPDDVTIDTLATSDDAIERALQEDTALNDVITKLDTSMAIEADDDLNMPTNDDYYDYLHDDGTNISLNTDSDSVSTTSSFKDFKSTPEPSRKNSEGLITMIKINSASPKINHSPSSLSHSSSSASSSSSSSLQKTKQNSKIDNGNDGFHLSPATFSTPSTISSSSSSSSNTTLNGKQRASTKESEASQEGKASDSNKDKTKEKDKDKDGTRKKARSSIRKSLKALKQLTKFADKEEEQDSKRRASTKFSSQFMAVRVDRLPQVFVVKYMGYQEVQGMFGLHHVRRPVDEMVKDVKKRIDTDPKMELPLLYLVVSPKGIDLREHKLNKVKDGFPTGLINIDFISYGVQDIKYWRVFTCIVVRELSSRSKLASCHAFLCDSSHSGRKLALALGAAFNVYSKKLQSDGKNHNFQVELRPPDELADAVHAEFEA